VLTGGAYLHISKNAPAPLVDEAKSALALFASTSPSYLVMQSLDNANRLLATTLPRDLAAISKRVLVLKERLTAHGYTLVGDEPMKLTISTKPYGYRGDTFAELLEKKAIVCEFCDPDFLVLMLSPKTTAKDLRRLEKALLEIPKRSPIHEDPPRLPKTEARLSPREALLAPGELTPIREAEGRILASPSVSCPPAIPILISGEVINAEAVKCFRYYGIETCRTVKQ
jgi:arginine/lysine/ornithine decarboxylase